ncbi:MAG: zinc ribbon domain-containing protein [Alphaproteobacteria bacterium]|nr:zinc ribbon domain-containing protein [Alphaproteobacteria bacterium]
MTTRCPACGHDNRPGAKFCDECGTKADGPAHPVPPPPPPPSETPNRLAGKIRRSKAALEGERKQVTVLFADVAQNRSPPPRSPGHEAARVALAAGVET